MFAIKSVLTFKDDEGTIDTCDNDALENNILRILFKEDHNAEINGINEVETNGKITIDNANLSYMAKEWMKSNLEKEYADKLFDKYRHINSNTLDDFFIFKAKCTGDGGNDILTYVVSEDERVEYLPTSCNVGITTFSIGDIDKGEFRKPRDDVKNYTDREYIYYSYLLMESFSVIEDKNLVSLIKMCVMDILLGLTWKFHINESISNELIDKAKEINDENALSLFIDRLWKGILKERLNFLECQLINDYVIGKFDGIQENRWHLLVDDKINSINFDSTKVADICSEIIDAIEDLREKLCSYSKKNKDILEFTNADKIDKLTQTTTEIKKLEVAYSMYFIEGYNKIHKKVFEMYFKLKNTNVDVQTSRNKQYFVCSYSNREVLNNILSELEENKFLLKYFEIQHKFDIRNKKQIKYPFSSGEYNIIKLISRINYFVELYGSNNNFKSIVLLLDEPDNTLHPEWQRTFLNSVIPLLENILFLNNKYMQLVITSHSPIMISDIPNCNLNMLDRVVLDDGTYESVDKVMAETNTFGANIYDLYRNNFFIKKPIGAFALYKINEFYEFYNENFDVENEISEGLKNIYGDLEKSEIIERELSRFYKMIKLVGEQLLREDMISKCNELYRLYNIVPYGDMSFFEDEKVKLKQKLEEIEKMLSLGGGTID